MIKNILFLINRLLFKRGGEGEYNNLFDRDSVWITYRKYKEYDDKLFKLKNLISF